MTNKLARRVPIDPEFEAVYESAEGDLPGSAEPPADSSHSTGPEKPREDGLQTLDRMAREQQKTAVNRRQFAPGSFDQIETDVSNVFKLGWDFLTR